MISPPGCGAYGFGIDEDERVKAEVCRSIAGNFFGWGSTGFVQPTHFGGKDRL